MNHTFKNDNGHLVATATFDKDEITKATDKAINLLCQNITVKGFRKGKAPIAEARKYIRSDDLANKTINELLKVVDKEFFKDPEFNGFNLLNGFRPNVALDKFSNEEAAFTITYVLRPYVSKLGKYQGIKADAEEKEVTDEDIEAHIKDLAVQNGDLVDKDEPAEMGDSVNIDFVGLLNGEAFDGGSYKGYDLELGSNRFVPGFEEQLVGHKAGDKVDVNVTLPAEYPEHLANKAVLFKVTINTVMRKQIPEINDEFATTLSGAYTATDLNDLKEKVRKVLTDKNHQTYQSQVLNSLLTQVKEDSEFVIPDEYLTQITENQIKLNSENIESRGLTLDDYLRLMKKEKEVYTNEIKAQVTEQTKSSLVYDAIFAAEKLTYPTEKDIEAKLGRPLKVILNQLNQYFKSQNLSDDQIRHQTNDYLNEVNSSIIFEKVQNRVLEINGYSVPEEEKQEEVKDTEEANETKDAPEASETTETTTAE